MKKLIYIFFLCGLITASYAQDETATAAPEAKKETSDRLPKSGDFALGVDATPYIEFLGNMFNGTSNNTLFLNGNTIYGKYYLSSDQAIRAELHINQNNTNNLRYVQDDANIGTNPNAQVEDLQRVVNTTYGIGVGYQQYRGYGKLRGTYGAVAGYARTVGREIYKWGNEMTGSNTTPTSSDWTTASGTNNPAQRDLFVKNTGNTTFSLGVIAGVEYFILPKICIGGELGLYYAVQFNHKQVHTFQTVEQAQVREYDVNDSPRSSTSYIRTNVYNGNNVAGQLYVLFHF